MNTNTLNFDFDNLFILNEMWNRAGELSFDLHIKLQLKFKVSYQLLYT